ncbi:hypothetical protein CDO87_15030 [Sagittula sp. P11]|uniref:hypothetical protein n=1 Tax=Sagittula sp. P11 TaxID=2009329 RepID=UPI000C2D510C|nr:hypothetical protein [Sagittula sp. P11]AUC54409.1 hypothetical protein CDO87_15030 [Sagittula sp. P11]
MADQLEFIVEIYDGVEVLKSYRLPGDIDIEGHMREALKEFLTPLDIENAELAEMKGEDSVLTVRKPGHADLTYSVGENPHITALLERGF